MQRFVFFILFGLLGLGIFAAPAFSQSPSSYRVFGTTTDTTLTPLPFCTVMLLAKKDSALIHFTASDENGKFSFKNVRKGEFFIKTTFVGYKYAEKIIPFGESAEINLGDFSMKPIAVELIEVVIREARAPLEIRGDTIEYNAATFKVPEGSTVEDLLRKLPGVMVDGEGNIKAQGKDVSKVTVDGKTFFGDDPKLATKNLPAEAVSKVQVFDTKSEQAKATGVDDGKKEKVMNLELKEDFKNGGFGKITAGAGTEERAELKGNYNKFDAKNQISFIGFANNVNQTGMSWQDYQDFRGANAFNSFSDNADFGFGGSGRYFIFSGDEQSLGVPIGNRNNRGFSKNYAAGGNYNYDNKKTKIGSNYFFNLSEQELDVNRFRESFLPENSFTSEENSTQNRKFLNHRLSFRLEHEFDSMNRIVVISNSRAGTTEEKLQNLQSFFTGEKFLNSQSLAQNSTDGNGLTSTNSLIFRHKFKKKGRSLAVSATFMLNQSEKKALQNSLNGFFQIDTMRNKIEQENSTLSASKQYKSSLFYIEPISKKMYWETFVNLGLREEKIERLVFDKSNDNKNRIDSMSRYYDGKIFFSRSGTSLRYTHNGFNVAAGIAAQNYQTIGDFSVAKGEKTLGSIDRTFLTFTPNLSVDWELPNGKYVSLGYDVNVNQPTSENLQPFADNSNPLYIRKGNPNLLPEVQHSANMSYNMFNAATFFNMMLSGTFNYSENQIVYNQKVDEKTLVTTAMPENLTGSKSAMIYGYTSFPIVKTKLTANVNLSTNFSNAPIFINGTKSETFSQNYNFGGGFSLTPYDFFTLYANSYMTYNKSEFSVSSLSTQEYFDFTNSLETNFKLPHSFFISSNIRHLVYKNEAADFNRSLAILNMSVYKLFGKDKKAEVRLSAYDIFNQNSGISQSYYQNFAVREVSKTLARYFMLTFSYNMRGMKADIRRSNSW